MAEPARERDVAINRRARYEYHIEETVEGGLVLTGTEVKALRAGRASLVEAFARVERGEVWLHGMHIPPYEAGSVFNHDPLRSRKVLLHRSQIDRLLGKAQQLAVARGKKAYDKREAIAKREAQRQIEKAVKRGPRGSDRR